ncbi:MAG: bifunctional folylpolyglutamate synthase/dihydrofolate synthase [Lentimicrobiaceae bacterium]|jgi:dihydrofolate synthase/folylpolyglutamate synthase|nr:bifunctional folylpolyglutamate synthase/dihydrofolate synthase [Lentimicrobiaceae bacterium]
MNYQEVLSWMFAKLPMYQRIGQAAYKDDLSNTIVLLNLLENPQKHFRSVHIAGTNGKGSTAHTLASVFQEAGYKTALYTSPHLRDFRERIRVNGTMIPEEKVIAFIERYRDDFETMQLSFFEMSVGMAFDYFAEEKVDIAIVETGMGGRLDSTNLIHPELSIITNISFDHIQFLGSTLAEIAIEKAGIIKHKVPVIVGETQPETTAVFEQKAKEQQSELFFADQLFELKRIVTDDQNNALYDVWKQNELLYEKLETPLLGNYQQKNLATVICALDVLRNKFEISEDAIRDGVANVVQNTELKGRWQLLRKNPLTIADTGHNISGIQEVVTQLRGLSYDRMHIILGMVNDKNHDAILQLLPQHATYYFCKANIPRGLDANVLAAQAFEQGLRGTVYSSVRDAYYSALNNARSNDIVFVGGSTFVVAEIV